MLQLTHLVHFDHAAIGVSGDDVQVSLLHARDLFANAAGAAGFTRGWGLGAVDRLREFQRQAAPANPGSAGEEVGVVQVAFFKMLLEDLCRPGMTDQVPTHRGIVAHCRGIGKSGEGERCVPEAGFY